jgi:peptide deformylase
MPVDAHSLHILTYPHPALRRKARPLERIDDEARAVASRMIELMRGAEGVGLAAPQVGLDWRLFVAEVSPNEERSVDADPPSATLGAQTYFNPRITRFEGGLDPGDEGCLSLPDITGQVQRAPIVTMEALDLEGRPVTLRAAGLLARCWQHEVDHLDGVLIIDRMTQMSRLKNRLAVRDLERSAARH